MLEDNLNSRIGLIPAALDERKRQIHWLDAGQCHFYEGFFGDALRSCAALSHRGCESLVSGLDDLPTLDRLRDSIQPSAFIFHTGRCGSTLLSKTLARSRTHLVFGEAAPHNQIWSLLPQNEATALDIYRRLIMAMGRRRLPSYRAHIIKFTSFNILRARFIRAAFPGVPALFLFRRPDALLSSYYRSQPAWLGSDHKLVRQFDSPETAVAEFYRAALSINSADFQYLDYDLLTPQSLPGILHYLDLTPPKTDLPSMLNEFSWNSKSRAPGVPFARIQPDCTPNVSPLLEDLYRQMKERSFDPVRG